jgi:hypothetical protein
MITLKITIMTATRMILTWMVSGEKLLERHLTLRLSINQFSGYNSKLENMNDSDDMEVDVSPMSSKSIKSGIERMLELGRELLQMSLRLEKKYLNVNDEIIAQNRKMMEVRNQMFDLELRKFIELKSNNFYHFSGGI